jgi:hypothetical protein
MKGFTLRTPHRLLFLLIRSFAIWILSFNVARAQPALPGTNTPPSTNSLTDYLTYPVLNTNWPNLWLSATTQSNDLVVTVHNAVVNLGYTLVGTTNLEDGWAPVESFTATNINMIAPPIPMGGTNEFFCKSYLLMRARNVEMDLSGRLPCRGVARVES